MSRGWRAALLASVFSLLPSCQGESDDSDTKTLDNFTAGQAGGDSERTPNHCGIEMTALRYASLSPADKLKLERIVAPTEALKLQAAGALAAVPKPLQRLLFASHGTIRVATDAAALCAKVVGLGETEKAVLAESGAAPVTSCWRDIDGLEVVLPADPAAIQHNLLRMFGFLYTEFLDQRLRRADELPAAVKAITSAGAARLEAQEKALAAALLRDIAALHPDSITGVTALASSQAAAFRSFAAAEAIDSYYCSTATYESFKTQFPETFKLFAASPAGDALSLDLGEPWHLRK
jgi:hypothetical protein